MKNVCYIFIFIAFTAVSAQSKAVELKIEVRSQDCSGVGIEPANGNLLVSQFKKKAFAKQTIYMYKKGKCVDSLITDSVGYVRRRVRSGNYDLYLAYKHKKTVPIKAEKDFDMECMKKEWLVPDGTLKVSWRGVVFVNKRIGFKPCDWNYNCLKERHIPAGSQG